MQARGHRSAGALSSASAVAPIPYGGTLLPPTRSLCQSAAHSVTRLQQSPAAQSHPNVRTTPRPHHRLHACNPNANNQGSEEGDCFQSPQQHDGGHAARERGSAGRFARGEPSQSGPELVDGDLDGQRQHTGRQLPASSSAAAFHPQGDSPVSPGEEATGGHGSQGELNGLNGLNPRTFSHHIQDHHHHIKGSHSQQNQQVHHLGHVPPPPPGTIPLAGLPAGLDGHLPTHHHLQQQQQQHYLQQQQHHVQPTLQQQGPGSADEPTPESSGQGSPEDAGPPGGGPGAGPNGPALPQGPLGGLGAGLGPVGFGQGGAAKGRGIRGGGAGAGKGAGGGGGGGGSRGSGSGRQGRDRARGGGGGGRSAATREAALARRDERIRQALLSSTTLLSVKQLCERHLTHMSAPTAAVGLSRLAALTTATQRLAAAVSGPATLPPYAEAVTDDGSSKGGTADAAIGTIGGSASGAGFGVGLKGQQQLQQRGEGGAEGSAAGQATDATGAREAALGGMVAAASKRAAGGKARVAAAVPTAPGRLQQESVGLMRRMLHVVAAAMDLEPQRRRLEAAAASGSGGGGSGSGGSAAAVPKGPSGAAIPRSPFAPPPLPSAAAASPSPLDGVLTPAALAAAALGTPTAPPSRFAPPEHRAKVAGTVLCAVARVGLRPGPRDVAALQVVMEAARPDLFLATPPQLCRLASSLPPLRLRPSPSWLEHFANVARSKMYAAGTASLASWVWALARLGYHPGDLWLHTLASHLQRGDNLAAATPGQLCQILWSLHRFGFLQATPSAVGAASGGGGPSTAADAEFRAAAAAAVAAALAGAPQRGASAAAAAVGCGPADVASLLLWAVRTGTAPTPEAVQACLPRLQPHLRSLRRVHLLRLLLALQEAGCTPPADFMAQLTACLQLKLARLGATQLTQVLLAVSALRYVPPQAWLVAFLRASRSQLHRYSPSHVVATYQVFAGWRLRPPRPYLEALTAYADGCMDRFTHRGLATVLHAMAVMGARPQRRWLARALDTLAETAVRGPAAGGAAAIGGSSAAPALAAAGLTAGDAATAAAAWAAAEEAIAAETAAAAAGGGSSNTGSARRLTAAQRQHAVRQQHRAALAASLNTAVAALRTLAPLEAPPPSPSPPSVDGRPSAAADGATAAGAPVALLPYDLWSSVKGVTDGCWRLLDAMSGEQLVKLASGLADLNFYPGRDFLAAHAAAAVRAGAQLSPQAKEGLSRCYARLAAAGPAMAAESRRQAAARSGRAAVLVGEGQG